MAFSIGGGGEDEPILADINVTPLVDVMLVLLIIFMIAAPMLHQGIEVALPRAEARNLPMRVEDPLVVSIDRDGDRLPPRHAGRARRSSSTASAGQIEARGDDRSSSRGTARCRTARSSRCSTSSTAAASSASAW